MAASGFDQESMMKQAQQIWSMLDEMAENDPASYKKFIEKQIKEGKEEMAPPSPHMCVKTSLKKETLFVNFFSWQRIPLPKSSDDPVTVMGTHIEKEKVNKGVHYLVSVAFNPKILEEYGRDSKNSLDQDTLINLAFDYIEEMNSVKCSRKYLIMPEDCLYKGTLTKLQQSFTKHTLKKDKKFKKEFDELSQTFGPLAGAMNSNGSLLDKLANIAVDEDAQVDSPSEKEPEIILPDKVKAKPGLIEEIGCVKVAIETPKYEIDKSWDDKNRGVCCVKIFLPRVASVKECELDISESDLSLNVPKKYELKLMLIDPIDDIRAKAKFNKTTQCLVVTMPLLKK